MLTTIITRAKMQRRSMIGPESAQCWSGDQFVLSPLCFLEADPFARVILEVNGLLGIILKMILRLNLRAYTFFRGLHRADAIKKRSNAAFLSRNF